MDHLERILNGVGDHEGKLAIAARLGALRDQLPDLTLDSLVWLNDKAAVLAGRSGGGEVIVKCCYSDGWLESFRREIEVYRAFRAQPPPFPCARAVFAEPGSDCLVLEKLAGVAVDTERFPRRPLDTAHAVSMAECVRGGQGIFFE